MPRFRKKPVVIEAWLFTNERGSIEPQWLRDARSQGLCSWPMAGTAKGYNPIHLSTLEGIVKARTGDWIIQGVKGELYPCKPDIFEQTYEPVEQEADKAIACAACGKSFSGGGWLDAFTHQRCCSAQCAVDSMYKLPEDTP